MKNRVAGVPLRHVRSRRKLPEMPFDPKVEKAIGIAVARNDELEIRARQKVAEMARQEQQQMFTKIRRIVGRLAIAVAL